MTSLGFTDIRNRTRRPLGVRVAGERARPVVLTHRLDDFDDLCERVRGWDLGLQRFDRGPFEANLLQAMAGPVQLSRARFDGHLQQLGAPPAGAWTFGIPEPTSTPFDWRGYEIDPEQLLVFRPGSELDSVSKRGFSVFTCSFPEALMEQVALASGLPLPSRALRESEVVRPSKETLRAIRNWLQGFFDGLERDPAVIHSPGMQRQLECELPTLLLEGLVSGFDVPRPHPVGNRKRVLERAVAYIADHVQSPLTVGGVSAAIGANERTLRRAFLDRFGVRPKTYLTAVRLDGARRDLRRRLPEKSVAEVAGQWGFWHMGDFAMKYRRAFGERPSETPRAEHLGRDSHSTPFIARSRELD